MCHLTERIPVYSSLSFATSLVIAWLVFASTLLSMPPRLWAGNPSGVDLEIYGSGPYATPSAKIGDIIKVKVNTGGGSEGVWFSTTGLAFQRGYFDHCGWCDTPCLVGDVVQPCHDCCGPYCLSCTWSSGHEFSDTWFGGPTIEYEVTGCGTATITPTYYGGSHEGPFTLKTYEITVLDGIVADFEVQGIGCVDEEVKFKNQSCGGTSFQWDFGDGRTSTEESPSHIYKKEGAYTVSLTASGVGSDTKTRSVTITSECAKIVGHCLVVPSALPLPGTTVKGYSASTSKDTGTSSGSTGYYEMIVAANEAYTLVAEQPGFRKKIGPKMLVRPKQERRWDVFMEPVEDLEDIDTASLNGDQPNNIVEPVNPATGNYFLELDLFSFPGVRHIRFDFKVAYNSFSASDIGPMGYGWTHSHHVFLAESDEAATVCFGDGHKEFFRRIAGTDDYAPFHCHPSIGLSKTAGGWKANAGGGLYWEFDDLGRLTRIYDLNDNAIVLQYSDGLEQITDTHGRTIRFFYSGDRLERITSPLAENGDSVRFVYDGNSDLTGIVDPRGNSWAFTYDASHRLLTKTDRRGVLVLTNVYDAAGRVVEQKDALGNATSLHYEDTATGKKVHVTPPSGHTYSHVYDAAFNLIAVADAKGFQSTFTPGANGKPVNAVDKKQKSASFESNELGLPTATTNRMGRTMQKTYNDHYQATSVTDSSGRRISIGYDNRGNMTSLEDPNFNYTRFWVNGRGQSYRISHPAYGGVWEVTYNDDGTLRSIKNRYNETTSYQYDGAGRIVQIDYPTGFGSLKNRYDANGNLILQESPAGYRTSFTHDENNLVLSRTFEPTGATTSYTYDAVGRTKTRTNPMGGVTTTTFDASGNGVAVEDPDGVVTRYTYDERSQLQSIQSPSGSETRFGYDPNGNRIWMRDPFGNTWRWTYDAVGRRTSKRDPLGNVTRYERSDDGRRIRVTDALNRRVDYHFDDAGRGVGVGRASGEGVRYHRNTAGMLTLLQDERGNQWRYAYDYLGRPASVTDPAGQTESYAYDAVGNRTQVTRRTGDVITYAYDLEGRLTSVTLPGGGSITYTHAYDAAAGTRTRTVTDAMGTTTEIYDKMDRLFSRTDIRGKTFTAAYTAAGRLNTVGYPGGKEVRYTYDDFGRLQHVVDWNDNATTYTYDGMDRTAGIVFPNGSRVVYTYDARGDVIRIQHRKQDGSCIVEWVLTRDASGQIIHTERVGDTSVGDGPDTARNGSYDNVNRILTQTEGDETAQYTFDADGNLTGKTTADTTVGYEYDVFHRLVSVSDGTNTTRYAYDAAGGRLSKTRNGTEIRYHRFGDSVLAVSDPSGQITAYHIYADTLIYSLDEAGAIRVYHADLRGSVAAVTDAGQNIIQTYTYGPYGNVTGAAGDLDNPFQFIGTRGVLADENGLYYMQARYYEASLGRFITEDPLGPLAGTNLYAYVGADPVNKIDPAGLLDPSLLSDPSYLSLESDTEALPYWEKPISFQEDPRVGEIKELMDDGNYRQAVIDYYRETEPGSGKAEELETIFDGYDGLKDHVNPGSSDWWHRGKPGASPDCIGCSKSMMGINAKTEYNTNLSGLQHFELVRYGIVMQDSGEYAHQSVGIVDKSTGKTVVMMDPIEMGSFGGQGTEIIPSLQGSKVIYSQTYDFEGGIMAPGTWEASRAKAFKSFGEEQIGVMK